MRQSVSGVAGSGTGEIPSKNNLGGDNRLESLLHSAFKKRLTVDYMSERSGIIGVNNGPDMRRYNYEVIQDKLEKYKTKGKRTTMTRDALVEFVA